MSDQWRKICDNYKEHNELLMEQLKEKNARILDLNNRAEELEEKLKLEKGVHLNFESYLREENQRYKQALEFYADKDNWEVHQLTDGVLDGENIVPPEYESAWAYADEGEVARQALKGDTHDRRTSI